MEVTIEKFPLMLMGVLAPRSAHARPSALQNFLGDLAESWRGDGEIMPSIMATSLRGRTNSAGSKRLRQLLAKGKNWESAWVLNFTYFTPCAFLQNETNFH